MKVKYLGESDPISLIKNKIYECLGAEQDCYRVIDEEGYDLFYFPDSDQKVSYIKDADDIKEIVDIIPKGRRK